jgi:hypothetical protein
MMFLLDDDISHEAAVEHLLVPDSPETLRTRLLAGEISMEDFETGVETALQLPLYQNADSAPIVKFQRRQSLKGRLRYGGLEVTSRRFTIRSGHSRRPQRQQEFTFDADPTLLHAIFARPTLDRHTRVEYGDYRTELQTTSMRKYPYLLFLFSREAPIGGTPLAWTWLREDELTALIKQFENAV